jgi:hypothetical protein
MGIGDKDADRWCHTPHKQDKIRGGGGGAYYKSKIKAQQMKGAEMKDMIHGHCPFAYVNT